MSAEPRLWIAPLDVPNDALRALAAPLSADERERARTFAGGLERRRFVADHGWRRQLLAEQALRAPDELRFVVAPDGKPSLADSALRFSASRAGSTALYAISDGLEVGVDLEAVEPDAVPERRARLAERILGDSERAAYDALAPAERPAALMAAWTRKEAYGKAVGSGLDFPLSGHVVWAGDDRPVDHDGWTIVAVDAGPGYAAAVAMPAGTAAAGDRRPRIPQLVSEG